MFDGKKVISAFNCVIGICVLTLIGCGNARVQLVESAPMIGVNVKDGLGRIIRYGEAPKRVISLTPSVTELIYVLGAKDKLVGVSETSDYPLEAKSLPKLVTFPNFAASLADALALKPECVIAGADVFEEPKQLDTLFAPSNIPVFCTNFERIDEVYSGIRGLGELLEVKEAADNLVASLQLFIKQLSDSSKNEVQYKCVIIISHNPLIVVGGKHYLNDYLKAAGGQNVFEKQNFSFAQTNMDAIVETQPDFAFIIHKDESFYNDMASSYPKFLITPASMNKQVFRVNPINFFRPGLRSIDAMTELSRSMHPGVRVDDIRVQIFGE